MAPRTYNSFAEAVKEVAIARVNAGIHTRLASEVGVQEGFKVAKNIDNKLKFFK